MAYLVVRMRFYGSGYLYMAGFQELLCIWLNDPEKGIELHIDKILFIANSQMRQL